jgi:WS/DGAT/MGAT family acyltransferase
MESISGLDASFLYIETPTSPMHVGSVAILEGSLSFKKFRETIASRLHMIPTLRKRLMEIPLSIDYPYWVDDPNFNLDLHLQHVALPSPGDWKALRALASRIFSEPLDRSRPLWSFTFVEGLDAIPQVPKGSVAIISKIHHVAIDGMAGAGIMSLLFDLSPEAKDIPSPREFKPNPLPNDVGLITRSAFSFATRPLKLPRILADTLKSTVKAGFLTRAQNLDLPTAPFTAPNTPLNGIISAQRKWNTAILSLERIKVLKRVMNTTLNDVMLAICSGALRRYLLEKEKLPAKPMVAMVPISTREKGDGVEGNRLSAMLVQLATHIEDPIDRLEAIFENTQKGKTYQGALGANTLSGIAEAVPFGVANRATRLYSRYHIAKYHNPVFNVVITNVPGPQIPLYLNGHKLISVGGMAPIIDGMGLIITIFSYNGSVTVSPTSDQNSMPDLDLFTRYLRESANELEAAVLAYDTKRKQATEESTYEPESDQFFDHMKKVIKESPELFSEVSGLMQFHVVGPQDSFWQMSFRNHPGTVRRGKSKKPDITIKVSDRNLMRIANGDIDIQTAFIQTRLTFQGDTSIAMALGNALAGVPLLNPENGHSTESK